MKYCEQPMFNITKLFKFISPITLLNNYEMKKNKMKIRTKIQFEIREKI